MDSPPISPFFTNKTLITILKVLPLNRDTKELICWKIIYGMMTDIFAHNIEEIIDIGDQNYYYQNYYDFYDRYDD